MRRSTAIAGGLGAAVLAVAALLYANHAGVFKGDDALTPLATGAMAKLVVADTPASAPDYGFTDPEGRPVRLADLRGKPAVVNVWAMWCAPCKEEMPTLAALARAEGDRVRVVTVNVDHDDTQAEAARGFLRIFRRSGRCPSTPTPGSSCRSNFPARGPCHRRCCLTHRAASAPI